MHIKRVAISGFKAVRNELVLEDLESSAVNAIVGANGSGKSCVLQAIAFALNPSSLDIGHASQVLSDGPSGITSKRAVVEVTMSTDESGAVGSNIQPAAVTFKRVMSADAEEYFLDGSFVSKKEYETKLESLGFSSSVDDNKSSEEDVLPEKSNIGGSHFLVEQGKVTSIASMTPVQRMKFFTETCGFGGYASRKAECVGTLSRLEKKRKEIDGLVSQLTERFSDFSLTTDQAAELAELKQRKARLDVAVAKVEGVRLREWLKTECRAEVASLEEQLADAARQSLADGVGPDDIDGDLSSSRSTLQALALRKEMLEKLITNETISLGDSRSSVWDVEASLQNWQSILAGLQNELENANRSEESLLSQKAVTLKSAEDLEARLSAMKAKQPQSLAVLERLLSSSPGSGAGSGLSFSQLVAGKVSELEEHEKDLSRQLGESKKRLDDLVKIQIPQLKREAGSHESELAIATRTVQSMKQGVNALAQSKSSLSAEHSALYAEMASKQRALDSAQNEYENSRREMWRAPLNGTPIAMDIRRGYDLISSWLDPGVGGSSLSARSSTRDVFLPEDVQDYLKSVVGFVCDLVDFPVEYSTAVDALLGKSLFNLLVISTDSGSNASSQGGSRSSQRGSTTSDALNELASAVRKFSDQPVRLSMSPVYADVNEPAVVDVDMTGSALENLARVNPNPSSSDSSTDHVLLADIMVLKPSVLKRWANNPQVLESIKKTLRSLFGGLAVVFSVEVGWRLASTQKFNCSTISGDFVSRSLLISCAGSDDRSAEGFSGSSHRKSPVCQLAGLAVANNEKLASAASELKAIKTRYETLQSAAQSVNEQLKVEQSKLSDQELVLNTLVAQCTGLRRDLSERASDAEAWRGHVEQLKREASELKVELARLKSVLSGKSKSKVSGSLAPEEVDVDPAQLQAAFEEIAEVSRQAARLRAELARMETNAIPVLKSRKLELLHQIDQCKELVSETAAKKTLAESFVSESQRLVDAHSTDLSETEKTMKHLEAASSRNSQDQGEQMLNDRRRIELRGALELLRKQAESAELKLASLNQLVTRFTSSEGAGLHEDADPVSDGDFILASQDLAGAKALSDQLADEIASKFGGVSASGSAEALRLETSHGEYCLLVTKRNDLDNATKTLEDLLDSVDKEYSAQLQELVVLTSGILSSIFSAIIPGGKASLIYEKSQEGSTGPVGSGNSSAHSSLHILVSLAGDDSLQASGASRLTAIGELSGGQKSLVALCFILSVMRAVRTRVRKDSDDSDNTASRSSSGSSTDILLLDEVDAALDEHHRGLVASLLAADSQLYGIQCLCTTFRPELIGVAKSINAIAMKHGSTMTQRCTRSEALEFVAGAAGTSTGRLSVGRPSVARTPATKQAEARASFPDIAGG